uniref:tetratricopeptide repeat protein n=1 Tax=Allorhizocola rhizosphaerae TaxID=1872709 RepID=UPI003CCC6969
MATIARRGFRHAAGVAGPLTPDESAELLAAAYGLTDAGLADQVHEATGGHAGLIRRYGERLAAQGIAHGPLPARLASAVTAELLSRLPGRARRMLAELSGLAPLSDELCTALGFGPSLHQIEELLCDGAVIPVVARSVRLGKPPAIGTLVRAGRWYEEQGLIASAVRAYASAGEEAQWLRLLDTHGQALLPTGHAGLIVELLGALPPAARSRSRQLLLGDALCMTGAVISAGNAYSLVADAEREWDAALALRMGTVHNLRGDPWNAIKAFDRAPPTAASTSGRASAYLQLGDVATATSLAEEAVRMATDDGDDFALAGAYVALALCRTVSGGAADLFARALEITERSGDVVLRARILSHRAYQLLCESRYREALQAARRTYQCAGHPNLRVIALCHEGDALTMLGRFDEAMRQYERAAALCRRMGARRPAAAELGMAEVYRRRGWLDHARGAYETAARLAEEDGNLRIRVAALAGLARTLLDTDPAAARAA